MVDYLKSSQNPKNYIYGCITSQNDLFYIHFDLLGFWDDFK